MKGGGRQCNLLIKQSMPACGCGMHAGAGCGCATASSKGPPTRLQHSSYMVWSNWDEMEEEEEGATMDGLLLPPLMLLAHPEKAAE